ncbi:MAG: hypothetical protein ACT4NL_17960 [Pseudomarimonas sp.]
MNSTIRLGVFAVIALALVACTAVPTYSGIKRTETENTLMQRQLLIGEWESTTKLSGGGVQTARSENRVDGTFTITFSNSGAPELPSEQTEVGMWGVSGGVYFTITTGFINDGQFTPARMSNPAYYDSYRILHLDESKFDFENLSSGHRFTAFKRGPLD